MSRLGGLSNRDLERVAESEGWVFVRQVGSHRIYTRRPNPHNLTIPVSRDLPAGTVRSLVKGMGLTVDAFLARLGR